MADGRLALYREASRPPRTNPGSQAISIVLKHITTKITENVIDVPCSVEFAILVFLALVLDLAMASGIRLRLGKLFPSQDW